MINTKEISVGSVAYFLTPDKTGKKSIKFGVVEGHYSSEICLQLYDFCERRLIDGVPVEMIEFPTKWQKLPKGWSYDTKLFQLGFRDLPSYDTELLQLGFRALPGYTRTILINNPIEILQAIKDGILVKVQDIDYWHFESVIDKNKGWRIERKPPYYGEIHPSYASIRRDEVYATYEQAKSALDAEEAELKRQAALSDYDWSVEQIDRVLNRWAKLNGVSDEEKQKCRDRILSLDKVEDVEVRLTSDGIQWKYQNNKRWITIIN